VGAYLPSSFASVHQHIIVTPLPKIVSLHQHIIIMTDSTENATPSKSTKSRNSNSSVQIQIWRISQFDFVPRDTVESEILGLVNIGELAISVWKLTYTPANVLSSHQHFIVTRLYLRHCTDTHCNYNKTNLLYLCQHVIVTQYIIVTPTVLTPTHYCSIIGNKSLIQQQIVDTRLYSCQHNIITTLPTYYCHTNTLLLHECTCTNTVSLHHWQHIIVTLTYSHHTTVLAPTQCRYTAANILLLHEHIVVTRLYLKQYSIVTLLPTYYCYINKLSSHTTVLTPTHCRYTATSISSLY